MLSRSFIYSIMTALGLTIALIIHYLFYWDQQPWILLSAFLINIFPFYLSSIRQHLQSLLSLFFAVFCSFLLLFGQGWVEYGVTLIWIIMFFLHSYTRFSFLKLDLRIFFLTFMALIFLANKYDFSKIIIELILGGISSIIVYQFFSPKRQYQALSQGVNPLLTCISQYFDTLLQTNDNQFNGQRNIIIKKNEIKRILISFTKYPEWVFDLGFNPYLRGGYRFFLIKIELLCEYLFSFDFFYEQIKKLIIFPDLQPSLLKSLEENKKLFNIIYAKISKESIQLNTLNDCYVDIQLLEEKSFNLLPKRFDIADLSVEQAYLIELVQHIKDMRKLILEVIVALP